MSDKFQDKYRIPSARWQDWDYSWNGAYFITICTAGRDRDFGRIRDGKTELSNLGIMVEVHWKEIANHFNTVELDAFVVMPNHIHGILILTGNGKNGEDELGFQNDDRCAVETRHALSQLNVDEHETRHALSLRHPRQNSLSPGQRRFQNQGRKTISSIIGSYKSAVSKHAHRLGINFDWQPRFYDHIIRSDSAYQRISAYIQNNPKNWPDDKFYLES
jgi:putative transposase